MKSFIKPFLVFCLIIGCQKAKKQPDEKNEAKEESFDWLLGKWQRTNDQEGQQTYELWKKESNARYLGHGFTMVVNDTVWEEVMEFFKNDSIWFLEVKTPGNTDKVKFTMTQSDSVSFTVENPLHDFPKVINYNSKEDQLKARVSGDSILIDFDFEKVLEN